MPTRTRHITTALLLAALALLPACESPMQRTQSALSSLHAQGRYNDARDLIESKQTQAIYDQRSSTLYLLERGALRFITADTHAALDDLEQAEQRIDLQREQPPADTIASWLLSDAATEYRAPAYADLYVNVLKILAHLDTDTISGGATVEARRLATKTDTLRDRYTTLRQAAIASADPALQSRLASAADIPASHLSGSDQTEFIESPLGTYLSSIAYLKDLDYNNQRVAARRLLSSLQLQRDLFPGIDPDGFTHLRSITPDDADLLVVALSGRAPTLTHITVGPIVLFDVPVYFQLPVMQEHPARTRAVQLLVTPLSATDQPPTTHTLKPIEDTAAVIRENWNRELPLIYARTLIRVGAKAAATFVLARGARDADNNTTATLIALAGLASLALTEEADTRSWIFLHARADVTTIPLEPGTYRLQTRRLDATGSIISESPTRDITITENPKDLVTHIDHYWN